MWEGCLKLSFKNYAEEVFNNGFNHMIYREWRFCISLNSEAPLKPSSNSLSILDYVYPILQAECLGMKFHFAQYIYSTAISTAFAFDIYYG